MVLYSYRYSDIDFIQLNFELSQLTLQLCGGVKGRQRAYLFECLDVEDIATILEAYCPQHVTWKKHRDKPFKKKVRYMFGLTTSVCYL